MTRFAFVIAIALAACGGGQKPADHTDVGNETAAPPDASPVQQTSSEYGCVVQDGQDPDACAAQGCSFGPPIWCSGVKPPDDWRQQRSDEACTCTCEEERERCSMMP